MTSEATCPSCKAPVPVPPPPVCPHCGAAYDGSGGGFKAFLRENWVWIVAPVAVAAILVLVLMLFFGNDDTSPFQYNIW